MFRTFLVIAVLCWHTGALAAQAPDLIRTDDVLVVAVEGQPSLTGRYAVGVDRTVTFPLIGNVDVVDQTPQALTALLTTRFAAYVRNPQVRVSIDRPSWMFVLGNVKVPGRYPLTRGLTVLESLIRAGYAGGTEVLVVRSPGARGPVMPDQAAATDVIRVNVLRIEQAFAAGDTSGNLALESNDTVFVPAAEASVVDVSGEIRNPGAYPVLPGTTVRQVITLAGGTTDRASLGRLRRSRIVSGSVDSAGVDLDDPVQPGDGLIVPRAFEIPSLVVLDPDAQDPPTIRLGRVIGLTPAFTVNRLGVDTNVLNSHDERLSDFITDIGTQLKLSINLPHVELTGTGAISPLYFRNLQRQDALNPAYGAGATITVARWLSFGGSRGVAELTSRYGIEDIYAERREETLTAFLNISPTSRTGIEITGRDSLAEFRDGQRYRDVEFAQTLTQAGRSISAKVSYDTTILTTFDVTATAATHRFPLFPARDGDATEFSVGATFNAGAIVNGTISGGVLRYVSLDPRASDYAGPTGAVNLWHGVGERTRFGGRFQRGRGFSLQPQFSLALVDEYGVWVQQMLTRRLDVMTEVAQEKYDYKAFAIPGDLLDPQLPFINESRRYVTQVGVRMGNMRVALDATYLQRVGPFGYEGLRMGTAVTYGVFDVRSR